MKNKFVYTWMDYSCRKTLNALLVLFVMLRLTLPWMELYAESTDPLFGDNAPALDSTAPEPTDFQLGDYGVAEKTGAATYIFPISVPPGRKGMEPRLSLSYSSRAPLRGGIAVGWSLDLPAIVRDTSVGTLDDVRYMATLNGTAGPLVQVADVPAFGGTTYRIERDQTQTRFEFVNQSSSDSYWVAWTTDGVRHYFGSTSSASDNESRWYLDNEVDPFGNAVSYNWMEVLDTSGNIIDYAITSVEYTSNTNAGLDAFAKVTFKYAAGLETCPQSDIPIGASSTYLSGTLFYEGARRLATIETSVRENPNASWRLVQQSSLTYDSEAMDCTLSAAPLRFLTQIDRVVYAADGSASTLPPISFSYGPLQSDMTNTITISDVPPVNSGTNKDLLSTLLEIDGDGIPDKVEVAVFPMGACMLKWYQGLYGGGYSNSFQTLRLPALPWALNNSTPGSAEFCTLMGQKTFWYNEPINTTESCPTGQQLAYRFTDVDGDGRVDLLTALIHDPKYDPSSDPAVEDLFQHESILSFADNGDYENSGESIPNGEYDPDVPGPTKCDQIDSEEERYGQRYVWRIFRNTGTSFEPMDHFPTYSPLPLVPSGNEGSRPGHGSFSFNDQAMLDIDGDGLLDLIKDPMNGQYWLVYPGDGTGLFGPEIQWSIPIDARPSLSASDPQGTIPRRNWVTNALEDINSDGLTDLLVHSNSENTLNVFMNTGTAFSEDPIPMNINPFASQSIAETQNGIPIRYNEYYHIDIDGDGMQDLFELSNGQPQFFVNLGDRYTGPHTLPPIWNHAKRLLALRALESNEQTNQAEYAWDLISDYMDANADGNPDLVTWLNGFMNIHSNADTDSPPRALIQVDNGSGMIIKYKYTPITNNAVVTRNPQRDHELPHKYWVVESFVIEDIQEDLTKRVATTRYTYEDPVYGSQSGRAEDPKRFLGFTMVNKDLPLGGRVEQQYDYDGIGNAQGQLVREIIYNRIGNSLEPASIREISWTNESLFGGLVTFTYQDLELTRTCDSGSGDCSEQTHNIHREETVYSPWNHPLTNELSLYLLTQEQEGESVVAGDLDRQIASSYEIRYSPTDYRVLTDSTEKKAAVIGSNGTQFETVERTSTNYDIRGLPIRIDTWIDASTIATTLKSYEQATGLLLTETKPNQASAGGTEHTSYTYDMNKVFIRNTTNELGHVVTTKYDVATGELIETSGPNFGEKELWTVDGLGRVLTHTVSVENASGGYDLITLEKFTHDDMAYFEQGIPRWIREEKLVDFNGSDWVMIGRSFDGSERILSETTDITGITDAKKSYRYDSEGNLVEMRVPDPAGNDGTQVSYHYVRDAIGRVVGFIRPDNTGIAVTYDGLIDQHAEITSDGSGSVKIITKDVFGRVTEVEEISAVTGSAVTQYTHGALDNVIRVRDADGNITTIQYDWVGRRTEITRNARTWKYRYDLNGNLIAKIAPVPAGAEEEDYKTSMEYDALDRITKKTPATFGNSLERIQQLGIGPFDYFYDDDSPGAHLVGRLSSVILPFGEIRYEYNSRGLIVFEERLFTIDYLASGSSVQWVEHEYNAFGQPTYIEHDDGTLWKKSYDERGLVSTVEWLDPQDGAWKRIAHFGRSIAGKIQGRYNDFNQRQLIDYDALGRPIQDEIFSGMELQLQSWRDYTYNDSSDLIAINGATGTVSASANYTYDGLHRILTASGPMSYDGKFEYTGNGNIESANVSWNGSPSSRSVTYEYGGIDPLAVTDLTDKSTGNSWANFAYDSAGNMIQRNTPFGTWDFEWDGSDRMRYTNGPSGEEAYYYDHEGNRMLAVNSDSGIRFWFGDSETHFNVDGDFIKRWIHLSGAGSTLGRVENGTIMALQYPDALQNLMATFDASGNMTSSFLYGAFGEVVHSFGAQEHRRQFNGKENDELTGLKYYGYRYYDPLILRWNSADPLYRVSPESGITEPQRMNLYTFSLNNPVRFYDPDGRDSTDKFDQSGEVISNVGDTLGVLESALGDAAGGALKSLNKGLPFLDIGHKMIDLGLHANEGLTGDNVVRSSDAAVAVGGVVAAKVAAVPGVAFAAGYGLGRGLDEAAGGRISGGAADATYETIHGPGPFEIAEGVAKDRQMQAKYRKGVIDQRLKNHQQNMNEKMNEEVNKAQESKKMCY